LQLFIVSGYLPSVLKATIQWKEVIVRKQEECEILIKDFFVPLCRLFFWKPAERM